VSSDCLFSVENVYPLQVQDYNILIIGIPNVGKSSIINALRQTHLGKGTAVYCIWRSITRYEEALHYEFMVVFL